MSFYNSVVVPRLIALAMQSHDLVPYRQRIGTAAEGRVLEIGIGSGLNLPFYGAAVRSLIGLDPSPKLLGMAKNRVTGRFQIELLEGSSEHLPIDNASVDTVVTTWTLCSVAQPSQALREVSRVLRPGGMLLFVEHGRSPEPPVSRWQDRITPIWKRFAGGCHLNRKMDDLVTQAGLRITDLNTGYIRGPKVMTYMYEGRAIVS